MMLACDRMRSHATSRVYHHHIIGEGRRGNHDEEFGFFNFHEAFRPIKMSASIIMCRKHNLLSDYQEHLSWCGVGIFSIRRDRDLKLPLFEKFYDFSKEQVESKILKLSEFADIMSFFRTLLFIKSL